MAIFELGIMKSGLLLVNRTYYEDFNLLKRVHITRRPQIISAVSKMVEILLNDSIKFIKMDNYIVGVYSTEIESTNTLNNRDIKTKNNNIASYCIGNKKMLEDQIFPLLKKITKVFINRYQPFNKVNIEDSNKYSDFVSEIDNILKDIQYTPLDRLKLGIL